MGYRRSYTKRDGTFVQGHNYNDGRGGGKQNDNNPYTWIILIALVIILIIASKCG